MCLLRVLCLLIVVSVAAVTVWAQATPNGPVESPKKANLRTPEPSPPATEPFDDAPIEKMAGQCVTLETELGPIEIAMGYNHACARYADGHVRCWGRDDLGQCGDGLGVDHPYPIQIVLP